MNNEQFYFVLFFKRSDINLRNNRHMIMCRQKDFKKGAIKRSARRIFPELFGFFKKPRIIVGVNYEDYSSSFDQWVSWHREKHDWDQKPFLGLKLS